MALNWFTPKQDARRRPADDAQPSPQPALAGADLFFASQASGRSYRRVSAGLRYALDPRAALKLEISRSAEPAAVLVDETGASLPLDAKSYRRASLQYSVAF